MELKQEFDVGIPVEEAWAVLTDLERIAPCMPGATLTEVVGDEYHGEVKVKVGPIISRYAGTARFVEQDATTHRAVLEASGRDARGQGNASATVTAVLRPNGGGTTVAIVTDLKVTGKVAQFGRGVLADVSATLLGQFVDRLEADLVAGQSARGPGGDAPPSSGGSAGAGDEAISSNGRAPSGARPPSSPDDDGAVDLLSLAGGSVLKRAVPAAGVLAGVTVLLLVVRRRRRNR